MILRAAAPADYEALIDLWQVAWQAQMPDIDFAQRRPGFTDYLKGLVAAGARLRMIETAEGVAAGFYTLDSEGYLDQVAVRHALWGQGIGRRLIADAKALAPGQLWLKVNQANLRAIGFYKSEGFIRCEAMVNPVSGLPLWVYRWNATKGPAG